MQLCTFFANCDTRNSIYLTYHSKKKRQNQNYTCIGIPWNSDKKFISLIFYRNGLISNFMMYLNKTIGIIM